MVETPDAENTAPAGLTQDVGWQIEVQQTLPLDHENTWSLLVSDTGTRIWLGTKKAPGAERGARYKAKDGTTGEVLSFRVYDRIRLSWKPKGWDHGSTVEVVLSPTADGTAVRFHQERLASEEEQSAMQEHWQVVLDGLKRHVAAEQAGA